MPGVTRFEDLRCWREARAFSIAIESMLRSARATDPNLANQLRRASLSIQTNIVEGFERFTPNEFHRFLRIARASAGECRALLISAQDRGLIDPVRHEELMAQATRVSAMMTRLMRYLREKKGL